MLICLDAGHGGKDSGACGAYSKEKNIALTAAIYLGEELTKLGFEVMYTRTTDTYVKLIDRARLANNRKADLFVSIHCNSAASAKAHGTETLCYEPCRVGELIQEALIKETGLTNRGLKTRKDLAVLNLTEMTAVLVEMAFISNPDEEDLLKNEAWLKRCVKAIARGICNCYGTPQTKQEVETVTMNVGNTSKTVKRILKNGENYIRLRDLESILKISYEKKKKRVSVSPK